ncbi:MAG: MFS transporter [Halobacteriovoraceae bacterium]|nr:MFS transporter [Halobacteriovoraceae bacterium]|tara:strand:+ start:142712 stop:143647 length:936 start_codon:yes stop_codon:yes gene_type:complete
MIEVKNISRSYGSQTAVDGLSFNVRKGSVHGFLGPNGAGKTTTMKILAAMLPPDSGKVLIDSIDTSLQPLDVRKKIGILLEHPPLFFDMGGREYLEYVARLRLVPKKKVRERVDFVLEKLGLQDHQTRLLGNLSKGYKQKFGVAQAIVHNPEFVILDEPTSGLDPQAVMEMRSLIKDLKNEHTVLFSSHLLKEADLICDDVTIISNGKLLASAPIEEIQSSLSEKTAINITVKNWSEELLSKIDGKDFVQSVSLIPGEGETKLNILVDSLQDNRDQLSRFIVEEGLGLLEMTQERPDLEKIFFEVVKRNDN